MLPSVKHHASGAKIRVSGVEAIKAIGNAISTLIALGNECSTNRREVGAILGRKMRIGRPYVRFGASTAVANRTSEDGTLQLEIPRHKPTSSRVT